MINELWNLQGIDRLERICSLSERDINEICRLHKDCRKCPLYIVYIVAAKLVSLQVYLENLTCDKR